MNCAFSASDPVTTYIWRWETEALPIKLQSPMPLISLNDQTLIFSYTRLFKKPWIYYICTLRCDSSNTFTRNKFLEECHNFGINSPTYSDSSAPRKFKHYLVKKSNFSNQSSQLYYLFRRWPKYLLFNEFSWSFGIAFYFIEYICSGFDKLSCGVTFTEFTLTTAFKKKLTSH